MHDTAGEAGTTPDLRPRTRQVSGWKVHPLPGALLGSRLALLVLILGGLLLASLHIADATTNPPGLQVDEASITYNALSIARHGVDEYGVSFPVYFRAFGEFKSPAYIYLLAAVFAAVGPSDLSARLL